jgi:tetratricopeptide (TPR) repeat protein
METGQWNRAETLFSDAVTASPSDADARRNLAETLWQQGMQREAAVHIEAAVRLDPLHGPTIVRSGEILLALGAANKSMQRADQAIRLDPTLAGGWALRGRLYRQQGDLSRALADLQQSLRYSPRDPEVLTEVAEIQFQMGKSQNCLSTLHCLLDTYSAGEEPQEALWLEGLAYKQLGRYSEAMESLHAANLRGQPHPDLLYELAQVEQSAGQGDAAANSLRLALALDAAHEPSRVMLAQLQQATPDAATQRIRR